jgi:hypothetical protein
MTRLTAWSKVCQQRPKATSRLKCKFCSCDAAKKKKKCLESTTKGHYAIKVRAGHGSRLRSLRCARQIMRCVHTTAHRPTTQCPRSPFGRVTLEESNRFRIYRHGFWDSRTGCFACGQLPSVPFLRGDTVMPSVLSTVGIVCLLLAGVSCTHPSIWSVLQAKH